MAAKHTDDTAPKRVARHKMACKRWARAFCAVHTFADKLFFIITDKGAIRLPSYTDIAAELYPKRRKSVPEGIALSTQHAEGITLTRVDITRSGFRRAPGSYITLDLPDFAFPSDKNAAAVSAVSGQLRALLPACGTVLVVGIGNRAVTADALGPFTADKVIATRSAAGETPRKAPRNAKSAAADAAAKNAKADADLPLLRSVAVLCPGVAAMSGIATAELLRGAIRATAPAAVICIDSLCTREPSRLGKSVQLSSAGLFPAASPPLSQKTLGVPVIALGVPTVTSLCAKGKEALLVTPKDIDAIVQRAAALLSLAVNRALQPALSVGELHFLMS